MIALQSSPPSLGPPVAALLAFVLVGGLIGAVGSAVVRRLSNPVGKYRLLYGAVLFPFTLLSYGVLVLLGFGPAIRALFPTNPAFLSNILTNFMTFLATGFVWLAVYAPTIRGVRDVREVELKTSTALSKMGRYVLGLSAVLAVVIVPLQALPSESSPLVLAVGLAAIAIIFLYASPWLIPLLRSTQKPTEDVANRVATLCSRADLDVRDVRILDTDDEETADSLVRGPPNYRRLFLTSTFLDVFDDDTATALLAIEAGRIDTHVFEIRVSTVIVAGIALIASLTGVGSRWLLLGFSVVVLLFGFWLSRRQIRAADEYAAEQVGESALSDALNRYADVHAIEPTRRRFPNPLSVNVPLGDRIDQRSTPTEA
jgi:STE24 endopeptidase